MSFLDKLFKSHSQKTIESYQPIVATINDLEPIIQALSDDEIKAKTAYFKELLSEGKTLDDILPEVYAVVREASKRTLGQRHFDVQLLGGVALHKGNISEMRTGEGKTLVATLPAYLNALEGKGVHVVTVNDYLSRRDAVWMGQIFAYLGLSVGVVNTDASYLYDANHVDLDAKRDQVASFKVIHEFLRPSTRYDSYNADITYGTNNEFGFDYLRDNIERDPKNLRQREFHYAVVDEIDSILIDEARTPLIISMPTQESENLYATFAGIAQKMNLDEDFTVDLKFKQVALTDTGITKAEKLLGIENIYTDKGIKYVHHLETAVRAKALYTKDKEYVVRDNEAVIVDEFTGRLQPGRRWSEGLHQAIEAKEGVKVQRESRTAASITFQNYFRLYKKLSGMTGTASTSKEEFFKVYGLDVIEVPTHRTIARLDHNDQIFQTEKGKLMAIAKKIKELNQKGQPVLVGTVSIEKNELLSAYLKKEGVRHQMLNAKPQFAEREGEIVAEAGKKGSVTIATNMAGRGVDIKLGGPNATTEEMEEVKTLGGLFVLGTERHEARRIDNQLRGRAGRQGDPGETQFFVSLEDDLMKVFATDTIRGMMGRFGIPEDEAIENGLITRGLENAQTKIEGFHFDSRKHVLQYDDVLSIQRRTVYERRRKTLLGTDEEVVALFDELLEKSSEEEKKEIEERKAKIKPEEYLKIVRHVILQAVDLYWIDHLELMDYTRSSVNLRAYGQRDPLVEYKKEALRLYREMWTAVDGETIRMLSHLEFSVK